MVPPKALTHPITCAANASLISIKSKSANFLSVLSSNFCVANTGPSPILAGSKPAYEKSVRYPKISKYISYSIFRLFSDTKITKAAPSVICEELPTVTLPVWH